MTVNDVPLSYTLTAGKQLTSTADASGINFWRITSDGGQDGEIGQTVDITNIVDPATGDTDASPTQAGIQYHWKLMYANGTVIPPQEGKANALQDANGFFTTTDPSIDLPSYADGTIYQVAAYVSDNDGYGPVQTLTVVVGTNDTNTANQMAWTFEEPNQPTIFNYQQQYLGISNGAAYVWNSSDTNLGHGDRPTVGTSNSVTVSLSRNGNLLPSRPISIR